MVLNIDQHIHAGEASVVLVCIETHPWRAWSTRAMFRQSIRERSSQRGLLHTNLEIGNKKAQVFGKIDIFIFPGFTQMCMFCNITKHIWRNDLVNLADYLDILSLKRMIAIGQLSTFPLRRPTHYKSCSEISTKNGILTNLNCIPLKEIPLFWVILSSLTLNCDARSSIYDSILISKHR